MRTLCSIFAASIAVVLYCTSTSTHAGVTPLGTAFTYQGELKQSGSPANGTFHLRFQLWNALAGGAQVGSDFNVPALAVANGLFTAPLDFGSSVFDGSARWLQVQVVTNGGATVTTLSPRQPVTAAPYALQTRGIFVNNSGNVGIGTTIPTQRLTVDGGVSVFDGLTQGIRFDTNSFNIANTDNEDSVYQYLYPADTHTFSTSGTPRLTINSNGKVGIGTDNPGSRLEVRAGTADIINSGIFARCDDGDGFAMIARNTSTGIGIEASAEDGIGVIGRTFGDSGGYAMYGECASSRGYDFYAAGAGVNYGSPSSIRWKRNIAPIDDPLNLLSQIRGVYFDWDKDHGDQHDIGFIGEEVGRVLPEIVAYEADSEFVTGMDYSKLTPLLVEAVKSLRAEKDAQLATLRSEKDAQIESLRIEKDSEISDLRQRLTALEAAVQLSNARNQH